LGMSCEKAICEIFNDLAGCDKISENRIDRDIINNIKPIIIKLFESNLILDKLTYLGNSNDKIDFINLITKQTYSLKTNKIKSNKIAPQIIGQPTRLKFNQLIYSKINTSNQINLETIDEIKNWIYSNVNSLLELYWVNLFCCNYLIYIKQTKTSYKAELIDCDKIKNNFKQIFNNKIITLKDVNKWNESNTVKIDFESKKLSIGEFQIHTNRDCIKFRFNFDNILKLINHTKLNETSKINE